MTTREAYQILEPAHFLRDDDVVQPLTPEDTETRRRLIDFVHELDTARFMLAMSFKEPYLDLVEDVLTLFENVEACPVIEFRKLVVNVILVA